MVTKSLNRSRDVNFNHDFDIMKGRLNRATDRVAEIVCNCSERFSWITRRTSGAPWYKDTALWAVITVAGIMGGLMYMAITTH